MKKVLFFTYDFPYPTTSGGKNRAYHMLKYGGKGVEIHLFSFIRNGFKKEYLEEMRKIGINHITLFDRKSSSKLWLAKEIAQNPFQSIFRSLYFSERIDKELTAYIQKNTIEILHAESFYTGFYITKKKKDLGIRQVYGSENVEYQLYKEYVDQSAPKSLRPFYSYQVKKIKKEEKKMSDLSDICITVSEEDKKKLSEITTTKIDVIDNGIDTRFIHPVGKGAVSNVILFVGNFSYFPNIRAINEFYEKVFVGLKDVHLVIVGKNAREKLPFVKDAQVTITNFVDDLAEVYKHAGIFVFPIRFGGGTNFKVLEAMAYGIPVVGFPDKMNNINGITEKNYIPVKDFDEMKNTLSILLQSKKDMSAISRSARLVIENNYSWDIIGTRLSQLWQAL